METLWMVTETLGGLGLLIASLGLMAAVIANVRSNRNVIAAFDSMREAFQLHAGHCHVITDTDKLKLDLRCVIARIEQANSLEPGDGMRDHLVDRLGNSDAPRLRQWLELLSGERAHVDQEGL